MAGRVAGSRHLVEEDERVGVKVGQSIEPRLTRGLHGGPLLFSRVQCPSLRVVPWCAKKRDRARWCWSARPARPGCRATHAGNVQAGPRRGRIRSACAPIAGRLSSMCVSLGSTRPCCASRCDQRLALDTATPNRAAARWKEASPATAATRRSRLSARCRAGSTAGAKPMCSTEC